MSDFVWRTLVEAELRAALRMRRYIRKAGFEVSDFASRSYWNGVEIGNKQQIDSLLRILCESKSRARYMRKLDADCRKASRKAAQALMRRR